MSPNTYSTGAAQAVALVIFKGFARAPVNR